MLPAAPSQAAAPVAGQVVILADRNGEPVRGLSVLLDGADIASTDLGGSATLSAAAGEHRLSLVQNGQVLTETTFTLASGEAAEIRVRLGSGQNRSQVDVFSAAAAGRARYSGTVTDELGEPIAGVAITVPGTDVSGTTDAEGEFDLQLPRGVWDVTLKHPSKNLSRTYNAQRVSPNLEPGVTLALSERRAAPTGAGIEEVVATARYVPDTSTALERSSDSVLDVISEQEISIAGDSDAAAALTRVTGVTIIDDLVFVRGLGDRYSAAYVNRAEVPSPDPSRRAISLDLFPTDLIKSISVQKTYTADLPADFSGGAVLIETRGIPDEFNFAFGASGGINGRSTGEKGLSYEGSGTDKYGQDNGRREIPVLAANLTDNGRMPLSSLTPEQREAIGEELDNNWNLDVETLRPDTGYSATVGDRYADIPGTDGRLELGFQVSALYDAKARFRQEDRSTLRFQGAEATPLVIRSERLDRSLETWETGFIGSFGARWDDAHSVDVNAFQTRQTLKGAFFSDGLTSDGNEVQFREITLDWVENDLLYQQVRGSNEFVDLGGLKIEWQASMTEARSDVLDRREYRLELGTSALGQPRYAIPRNTGPLRAWEFLEEDTADTGVDVTLPLTVTDWLDLDLKAGIRRTDRNREFRLVRWRYVLPGSGGSAGRDVLLAAENSSVENVLTPEFIRPMTGFELVNANSPDQNGNADSYLGDQQIAAHYGAIKLRFSDVAEFEVGVREEDSLLKVGSRATATPDSVGQLFGQETRDTHDVLPAATAAWFIGETQQVRAGYSRAVNRPQFRELSRTAFRDPDSGLISFGNPDLQPADVVNWDLRYEYYWNGAEGVTAALFLKEFTNPIEVQLVANSSGDPIRTYANADEAEVYGIEFDGRWELDEFSDFSEWLSQTYVSGNLSLIESEVQLDDGRGKRPLQGQSPWIANLTLGYSNASSETDIALLVNVFGERIVEAGFLGLPDAEEQPAPMLDFNLKQTLYGSWKLGFKLRNLLDPAIEVRQGDEDQRRYKLGTTASFSVEYQF